MLALGALALAFGVVEAVLIFYRRWVQSGTALGMETTIRNELYAHLQRLPVEFHDGWQSGQLLSRVTSDLGVIRRFLSFGLIFLVINVATFVTVIALLFHLYWPSGLVVAVSAVPLFHFSRQFTSRYNAAARKMQDEQGDLATIVEETAGGIRVIKAFGRRDHMAGQFATSRPDPSRHRGRQGPDGGLDLGQVRRRAQRDARHRPRRRHGGRRRRTR